MYDNYGNPGMTISCANCGSSFFSTDGDPVCSRSCERELERHEEEQEDEEC
jgi:hypothetical protein